MIICENEKLYMTSGCNIDAYWDWLKNIKYFDCFRKEYIIQLNNILPKQFLNDSDINKTILNILKTSNITKDYSCGYIRSNDVYIAWCYNNYIVEEFIWGYVKNNINIPIINSNIEFTTNYKFYNTTDTYKIILNDDINTNNLHNFINLLLHFNMLSDEFLIYLNNKLTAFDISYVNELLFTMITNNNPLSFFNNGYFEFCDMYIKYDIDITKNIVNNYELGKLYTNNKLKLLQFKYE